MVFRPPIGPLVCQIWCAKSFFLYSLSHKSAPEKEQHWAVVGQRQVHHNRLNNRDIYEISAATTYYGAHPDERPAKSRLHATSSTQRLDRNPVRR
jgi:hypothetical protein